MQRDKDCPVQGALDILGGKWRMAIIYTLSKKSPQRFKAVERAVKGITPRMLIKELKELEGNGILSRTHFPTIPPTVEYALTDFGETTLPIVRELKKWGKKQMATDENPLPDSESRPADSIVALEEGNPITNTKTVSKNVVLVDENTITDREPVAEAQEEALLSETLVEPTERDDASVAEIQTEIPETQTEDGQIGTEEPFGWQTEEKPIENVPIAETENLPKTIEEDIQRGEPAIAKTEAEGEATAPPLEEPFGLETEEENLFVDDENNGETEVSLPTENDDIEESDLQENTIKNDPLPEKPVTLSSEENSSDTTSDNADGQEKAPPQQFSLF